MTDNSTLDDSGEHRIGRNEALFRHVNEQVATLNESFGDLTGTVSVVCECGNQSCIEQIELALAEYERVRADSTWFAVKPGHEIPDVEHVLERHDRYWVVQKDPGEAAEVARRLDERA